MTATAKFVPLLRLHSAFQLKNEAAAALKAEKKELFTAGWGRTDGEEGNDETSQHLKKVGVKTGVSFVQLLF